MSGIRMDDGDPILGCRECVGDLVIDDSLTVAFTDESVVLAAVACQYGELLELNV